MRLKVTGLVSVVLCLWMGAVAEAEPLTWRWSFAAEQGRFVTDGTAHVPGTYTLLDFAVTASSAGGTIGSVSDGQYDASGFTTERPYSFVWDGSRVTLWNSAGHNTFDWWPFDDLSTAQFYFFGWNRGNVNDASSAALWNGDNENLPAIGAVSVAPSNVVPEPGTLLLMTTSVGLLVRFRRTRAAW